MNLEMIVFDVDGVILDFNTKFVEYNNRLHPEKLLVNPDDWNFGWKDNIEILKGRIINFIDTNPILPILDKYWSLFTKKYKDKYVISIVTAYPNKMNRIENLKIFDIKYDNIYFVSQNDKIKLIKQLNPVYVFEDCPEVIEELNIQPDTLKKIYAPKRWNYLRKFKNHDGIILYDKLIDVYL